MKKALEQLHRALSSINGSLLQESYEKKGVRPSKDWLAILPTILATLVLSGVCAYIIYIDIQQGTLWQTSNEYTSGSVFKINQKDFEFVTNLFNQKEKNLSTIQGGIKTTQDPSL